MPVRLLIAAAIALAMTPAANAYEGVIPLNGVKVLGAGAHPPVAIAHMPMRVGISNVKCVVTVTYKGFASARFELHDGVAVTLTDGSTATCREDVVTVEPPEIRLEEIGVNEKKG